MEELKQIIQEKINSTTNPEERKKYYLIEELLREKNIFFQINKSDACEILYNLGIENLEEYYEKLISPTNFLKIKEETEISINKNTNYSNPA